MGLKERTLELLIESGSCPPVADSVSHQMLQALDCLAWKGIVHRDVKPENILYVSQPGGKYQFPLGDFGLCSRVVDAATFAGSRLYMAPEMFRKGGSDIQIRCLVTLCHNLVDIRCRRISPDVESI
jgi:serine/threonine protein kinase